MLTVHDDDNDGLPLAQHHLTFSQDEETNLNTLFQTMPSSHPAPWELTHPQQSPLPPPEDDEDTKAPYDDLIDQYATPFSKNPQHQVYSVDAGAFDRGASRYSLDQKSSHMNDKDLEGSTAHGHDWEYPPPKARQEKEVEKRNCLAAVRRMCFVVCQPRSCMFPAANTRLTRVPPVSADGPRRDSN